MKHILVLNVAIAILALNAACNSTDVPGTSPISSGSGNSGGSGGGTGGSNGNKWVSMSSVGAPPARKSIPSTLAGTKMVIYGGWGTGGPHGDWPMNDGAIYDPSTDSWTSISPTGAPTTGPKLVGYYSATNEIFVFGYTQVDGGLNYVCGATPIGAKYNLTTHVWNNMSAANGPSHAVADCYASRGSGVWTGSKLIWFDAGQEGKIYSAATDTWTNMSLANAPTTSPSNSIAIGSKAFYFSGGANGGYIYDPASDTWTTISSVGAPSARSGGLVVWTGTEVVVWGGSGAGYLGDGAKYNPSTDTWTPITNTASPGINKCPQGVWDGTDIVMYGGYTGSGVVYSYPYKYNPTTDTWTTYPDGLGGRRYFAMQWTGSQVLIWGGTDYTSMTPGGGRYVP